MNVILSELLPPNTIVVSSDVYEALKQTPEEREYQRRKEQGHLARVVEQLKAAGLSPTGRKPSEPEIQPVPVTSTYNVERRGS